MSQQDTADREMVLSRLIDAPRALVFEAFTTPEHVGRWWGPNGFTTTTREMEFKPGGKWIYTMHGPDGRDYPNWIHYHKIVPNERIEYSHGSEPDEPAWFEVTATFEEEEGKTRITTRSLFPTKEILSHLEKEVGAREGGKQHLANLEEYVLSMRG